MKFLYLFYFQKYAKTFFFLITDELQVKISTTIFDIINVRLNAFVVFDSVFEFIRSAESIINV